MKCVVSVVGERKPRKDSKGEFDYRDLNKNGLLEKVSHLEHNLGTVALVSNQSFETQKTISPTCCNMAATL